MVGTILTVEYVKEPLKKVESLITSTELGNVIVLIVGWLYQKTKVK